MHPRNVLWSHSDLCDCTSLLACIVNMDSSLRLLMLSIQRVSCLSWAVNRMSVFLACHLQLLTVKIDKEISVKCWFCLT